VSVGTRIIPHDREIAVARADLGDCVMAARWGGRNTMGALGVVSDAYGVSLRWVHKLFYSTGYVAMDGERRRELALRAADFLDGVADHLERRAETVRAIAADKRHREEQLMLPWEQGCDGGKGWQKCAA
jgi:hypothetical protein